MSSFADGERADFDGIGAAELAQMLSVPRAELYGAIGSTLDIAHQLGASGTAPGAIVIADEQTAGRGRLGRRWASAPGAGLWLTVIERPTDLRALDVMALRVGLYVAEVLDELAGARTSVKWPNDIYVGDGKLGGILIETRWRGAGPEWVAVGVGLNVVAPSDFPAATGMRSGVTRVEVLRAVVPAIRRAALAVEHLSPVELARWQARDFVRTRMLVEPSVGRAVGISASGELLVENVNGLISAHRSGSVVFQDA